MTDSYPKAIPADMEQIGFQTDEILEQDDRVRSIVKVLGAIFSNSDLREFFDRDDVAYQLDILAENVSLLHFKILTLKSQVNYLSLKNDLEKEKNS